MSEESKELELVEKRLDVLERTLNLSRNALMSLKEPCLAMDIKD